MSTEVMMYLVGERKAMKYPGTTLRYAVRFTTNDCGSGETGWKSALTSSAPRAMSGHRRSRFATTVAVCGVNSRTTNRHRMAARRRMKTRRETMNEETKQLSLREQLENLPETIAFQKLIEEQRAWVEEMNRKRGVSEKGPKGN